MRRFGYLIASLSQSQANLSGGVKFFEYNNRKALFIAHETNQSAENTAKSEREEEAKGKKTTSTDSSPSTIDRKLQLMKSMAQLRLEVYQLNILGIYMIDFVIIDFKAEISQLELCCNKADENQLPPYLVPDSKVLCNNLRTIQDAVRTNKSIIIIPLAVIDDLDSMKKETKLARDAIRWLESQFRQGNR